MDLLYELFCYNSWATLQLVDFCSQQSPEVLQKTVIATNRSILHTLTHLVGSEQGYLEEVMGEKTALPPVRQGEILSLQDIRDRSERLGQIWEEVLDRIDQIDITIPAEGSWPETPHGQNVLMLQAIQHGIDHRTQICTTLSTLGLKHPRIDGWRYWLAEYLSGAKSQ